MPAPQDVRKHLLIIKSQKGSLPAIEQFLGNREWKLHATTNLKEALTYLISQKPSFVMISMDHPNKKVRALPRILSQALPCFVMAYTESSSTLSFKNLIESGCQYRINPPATGPAVERTINKILKDQEVEKERKERERLNPSGEGSESGSDKTVISGGGAGSMRVSGGAGGSSLSVGGGDLSGDEDSSLAEIIRRMTAGEDAGDEASHLDGNDSEAPGFAGSSSASPMPGGQWVPMDPPPISAIGDPETSDDAGSLGGPFGSGAKQSRGEAPGFHQDPNTGEPGSFDQNRGPGAPGSLNARTAEAAALQADRPVPRYNEDDLDEAGPSEMDSSKAAALSFDPPSLRTDSGGRGQIPPSEAAGIKIQTTSARSVGFQRTESIMVRGTQAALDDTVEYSGVSEKLQDSSNVACLIVESARFSGYLVAALGKNRKIDETFVDTIRDRLLKFLRDNGESVAQEGTLNLKIKKVDFQEWALEYAEFLRKSVHNGEEIAMAFFPFAQAKTQVEKSASDEMGAIDVSQIEPEVELDFNLYVYLPTNKRYVLYTPRGSKFYTTQKDRLSQMGVSQVHVKRSEIEGVDKTRAQSYLNSKIDDFHNRNSKRKDKAA